MRKILRATYYLGVIIIFVLIAAAGFTQTRAFRSFLHYYILANYHQVLNAQLRFERIEGNLVSGFSVHNVSVQNAGTDLFHADRIEFRYDPLGFIFKRIPVSRVTIVHPTIHLFRSSAGVWNVEHLARPAAGDSTPSPWKIDLKHIELIGATVTLTDSLALLQRLEPVPDGVLDYSNFTLDSLGLIATAQVSADSYGLQIKDWSWRSANTRIKLVHMRGDFAVSQQEAVIRNLFLETEHSRLRLDAGIQNTNILRVTGLKELETRPVTISLRVENIDATELKRFLYPYVDFLDQDFRLQLKCGGTLGRLSVTQCAVETPRSLIQTEGMIFNLHKSEELRLELSCTDNKVDPRDLVAHLPGLHLPDLSALGTFHYFLAFEGSPNDFRAHLVENSDVGGLDATASIKIDKGLISYEGSARTRSLNLAPLVGDKALQSDLNSIITFNGDGLDLATLSGVAKVEMDSSQFYQLPVGPTVLVADIAQRQLHSHVSANVRSTNYDFSANVRFGDNHGMEYGLEGIVNSLDLSDLLHSTGYESDLSFRFHASGKVFGGVTSASAARQDSVVINFLESSFAKQSFRNSTVAVRYDAVDSLQRLLSVRSDVADVDVKGTFTPESFVSTIQHGVEIIGTSIASRLADLDSVHSPGSGIVLQAPSTPSMSGRPELVEAQFSIRAKNLFPLGIFLHEDLVGAGTVDGEAVGSLDDLLLSGSATVDEASYETARDIVAIKNSSATFYFNGLSRSSPSRSVSSSLDIKADEFRYNKVWFQHPSLSLVGETDSSAFQMSALVDSTVQVDLAGTAQFRSRLLALDLSSIKVETGSYAFENIEPISVTAGRDWFHFKNFRLVHDAEEIEANGYFNPDGASDVTIELRGFLANNLRQVLARSKFAESVADIGGAVNLTFTLRGSLERPNVSIVSRADGVRARDKVFGSVETNLSYNDHLLNVYVRFRSRPEDLLAVPDLLLSGSMPYEFSLKGEEDRAHPGVVDLLLQSKGLRLEFLEPFIPELSNLSGLIVCDMKMTGSTDAPRYEGSMSIQGARFLFKPLGIQYLLSGEFVPTADGIQLQNFVIKNLPQDRSDGAMNVSGPFTMSALTFKDFDFLLSGQLLVMKETSSRPNQSIYGNLFAATGPAGIRWQGNLAQSYVRGEMVIKSASLTLPPDRDSPSMANRSIKVVFKDDTSKSPPVLSEEAIRLKNAKRLFAQLGRSDPDGSGSSGSKASPAEPTTSFLDRINYDLRIETQGTTQLKFVFTTQTNEELFADLQGSLSFSKTPSATHLTGEVEVGDRSYYNFFKKFQAKGKLLFTGDPLNPELFITARYEGIHDTSTVAGGTGKGEKVAVIIDITGTRKEPKPKMSLEIGGQKDTKRDAESDGISFILTNQFRDELTDQQRRSVLGSNVGYGLASGVLSGPLTEMLRRQTGIIQSVDVLYYGGRGSFGEAADVRLTGQLGNAVIRLGGHVLNDLGNTNASVEVPMSSIVGSTDLRNLILTLERKVEGVETNDERRTASNGARLFYRISF